MEVSRLSRWMLLPESLLRFISLGDLLHTYTNCEVLHRGQLESPKSIILACDRLPFSWWNVLMESALVITKIAEHKFSCPFIHDAAALPLSTRVARPSLEIPRLIMCGLGSLLCKVPIRGRGVHW